MLRSGAFVNLFFSRKTALAFLVAGAVGASAKGQSFTGTVLYELKTPSGYGTAEPMGASEGEVVGEASDVPFVWGTNGIAQNIEPTSLGIYNSTVDGTNGTQQVGFGTGVNIRPHAVLWNGTAASAVDLNPSLLGVLSSWALNTNGTEQVGYGLTSGDADHAILWTGTANSAVDLNPSTVGFVSSAAQDVSPDGSQEVGSGALTSGGNMHALLWNGTANSAVDLNPAGFNTSTALGTSGSQQVGVAGVYSYTPHAIVWNGTAASAVDLNPTSLGFDESEALSTNGVDQVGYGIIVGTNSATTLYEATWWSGTAASAVNLQSLLPASGTWLTSEATEIDAAGNVFGVAQGTYNGVDDIYAVEWSPVTVPEPGSLGLLVLLGSGFMARLRRS
jgi:hypothetical protein